MKPPSAGRPTLGAYLVGAYLFSVPAFAYSESLGLMIIPQITGAILVGYALIDILHRRSLKIPLDIQLYGFMGLWALITFFLGVNTDEQRIRDLFSLLKVVIATLACAQLIKDDSDLFAALKMFVFSILLVYYQNRYDLQYLRVASQITEADRFAGTLANANTAAIYSLTVIWASVLLLLRSGKGLLRWGLLLISTGISLLIIYYSGSKKGLIGIGLFVLFLAGLLYSRQGSSIYRKGLIVLISASLVLVAGYYIYTSPFFFRMEQMFTGGSGSDINRWDLAGEAIHVWLMNGKTFLMGVGYGNFSLFSELQTYSHSTPLELLAGNGLIGLFLFMGFLTLLFRKFIFLYKYTDNQDQRSIVFGTLIFLAIFTVFMLAAVMHESRELLPILGALSAFGQYQVCRLSQTRVNNPPVSAS